MTRRFKTRARKAYNRYRRLTRTRLQIGAIDTSFCPPRKLIGRHYSKELRQTVLVWSRSPSRSVVT